MQYDDEGRPARIEAVVLSTQHSRDVSHDQIRKDVIEHVIRATVPGGLLDSDTILGKRLRECRRSGRIAGSIRRNAASG